MSADKRLIIKRPDDFHVHFRDGDVLKAVVGETARDFARAIVMPNLVPPVVTAAEAIAYRERILAHTNNSSFLPLMTLYLTESSDPSDIKLAAKEGIVNAVKLYPAGATTNSDSGVTSIDRVMPALEAMVEADLPLCVHGEVTDPEIDIFDREAVFIERVLIPLRKELPDLRIVMEHVTTREGVQYVQSESGNIGATITPHHLIINRNDLLVGGIRPHYYCLPIAKRELHRQALRKAVTSGDSRFFLGTDSAPHTRDVKENACGCAGVFNATNTMPCLAQVFEEENALDKLEGFTSVNGARFYRLEISEATLTLQKQEAPVTFPTMIHVSDPTTQQATETAVGYDSSIVVFDPGMPIYWSVVS